MRQTSTGPGGISSYKEARYNYITYIVMCQVHPVLVKTGQMYGPFLLNFFVGSSPVGVRFGPDVNGPKDPWPRVLLLPGARVVYWRPHLAGTRQYHPYNVLCGEYYIKPIINGLLIIINYY